MPKLTLFAYAKGTDLEPIADVLETRLDALVASRAWKSKDVWVVNQRFDGPPIEWDLGLNLALPSAKARAQSWLDDVTAIAAALGAIHEETGRAFVMGIHDAQADTTKDLFVVDQGAPDLEKVKRAFTG